MISKSLLFLIMIMCTMQGPSYGQDTSKKDLGPLGLSKDYVDPKMRSMQVGEAEPYRPPVRISWKYYEGEFLIYDCKSRHFACVNQSSYERCKEARQKDLDTKAERVLACAPLKIFPTLTSCSKEQYILQHRRRNKAMCLVEIGAASN